MLTGELRSKVDRIWDGFWSGGISNPLEVIEQITYLLFIKRLDDLQTLEENRAGTLGEPMRRTIFPHGSDRLGHPGHQDGRSYDDLRWSRFKHLAPPRCTRSWASMSSRSWLTPPGCWSARRLGRSGRIRPGRMGWTGRGGGLLRRQAGQRLTRPRTASSARPSNTGPVMRSRACSSLPHAVSFTSSSVSDRVARNAYSRLVQ
jgi:hypothetical protein